VGSLSKAVKCPQSDPSTSSPSGAQQIKKPKVPEQKTYAQVTFDLVRVANVPTTYSDRKFTEQKVILLKRSVDLVKGTKASIFQGTSNRDDAVIFNCANEETVEWLKSITTVLSIKEATCTGSR
jgi:hypothetical protein